MYVNIQLSTDEVRRLIAWKDDYTKAFYLGEIMAANYTDDGDWTGLSAGNDFNYQAEDDGYEVYDDWGPFEIWDVDNQTIEDIRNYLSSYPTVQSALNRIDNL